MADVHAHLERVLASDVSRHILQLVRVLNPALGKIGQTADDEEILNRCGRRLRIVFGKIQITPDVRESRLRHESAAKIASVADRVILSKNGLRGRPQMAK